MLLTRKSKGQMLIEVVIALGVLSLVLIGVSDLMTRSQRVGSFQAKRDEALSVARSLLNGYRIERDNDPVAFEAAVVGINRDICVDGKDYSCKVEVTKSTGLVDLLVTVSWPDGDSTLSINLHQSLVTTGL